MGIATLAAPGLLPLPQISPDIRRAFRPFAEAAILGLRSALFAAALWLMMAGPGIFYDVASTVPLVR